MYEKAPFLHRRRQYVNNLLGVITIHAVIFSELSNQMQ